MDIINHLNIEFQDEQQQVGLQLAFILVQQLQVKANLMNVIIERRIEKRHQGTGGIGHDNNWDWAVDCIMDITMIMLMPELRFEDPINYFNYL